MFRNLALRIANSPRLLLMTFCVTMLAAASAYSIAEKASFFESIYWALVTATSLGYSDVYPHSFTGKFLTSIVIAFTVFILVPTITANVASWLIVNRDAWTHEEQETLKADLASITELLREMREQEKKL